MSEQSLADTVLTMIRSEANNNPAPVSCTVKQVYTGYVDVTITDGTVIRSVRCLGDAVKGDNAVLVFLDGDYSNMLVIPPPYIGEGVVVDAELSSTSVNPVQNKVIKGALDDKVDKEAGKSLFSGSYTDLTDKPSIPSDVSDLTDTQNTQFTPKSHTHTVLDISDIDTYTSTEIKKGYILMKNLIRAW